MPTLALSVAYNGAPFCGYAKQPDQVTVQGEIEDALAIVFKRKIDTVCAGRTDAGVHALGQVVSFEVSQEELNQKTWYLCHEIRPLHSVAANNLEHYKPNLEMTS